MTLAICIRCGAEKFGAYANCPTCGMAPETVREQAYSLAISDHYFKPPVLNQIARDISKTGKHPSLPPDQERKFLAAVANDRNSPLFLRLGKSNNRAVELKQEIGPEFEQLRPIPSLVFTLIAQADGRIDAKEIATFESIRSPIKAHTLFKSPLMRALLQYSDKNPVEQSAVYDPNVGLNRFARCIDLAASIVKPQNFEGIADDVSTIGNMIADASGGIFWNLESCQQL